MHGGEDVTGVMFTRYRKDGKRNTLFANYGKVTQVLTVEIEASGRPEVWDTFTGEIESAPIIGQQSGRYTISLSLPAGHGVFVVSQ